MNILDASDAAVATLADALGRNGAGTYHLRGAAADRWRAGSGPG